MKYKKTILGVLLFALGILTSQARAERLFATTKPAGGTGASTLVEINPTTGALISTVGNVGYAVNGLTYDQTTNTLYATTTQGDGAFPSGLLLINLTTGAGTPIGTGGVGIALGDNTTALLAVNSAGQLYSWLEANNDDLIIWNKVTGTASIVGDSGLSTGQHGLAFDNTDALHLINSGENIYQINTTTGGSTLLGNITPNTPNSNAHHGDFNPVSNLYYGLDTTSGTGLRSLLVINTSTQTLVNTIASINNLHTLAFIPDVVTESIPTLSPLSLILLSLLLLLFVISKRRKI